MHWQDSTAGAVSTAITGLPGILCLSVFSVAIAFSQSSETHGLAQWAMRSRFIVRTSSRAISACASSITTFTPAMTHAGLSGVSMVKPQPAEQNQYSNWAVAKSSLTCVTAAPHLGQLS